MASEILDPTAALIAAEITGLTVTEPVKGYAQDPGTAGLDKLPAGVVGLPTIGRTNLEEPEPQVGSNGWWLDYPVEFYFDIGEATFTATQAVETIEAFIVAIDANASLGQPSILDTKVTTAEPIEILDAPRPMLAYAARVAVLKLVNPSP